MEPVPSRPKALSFRDDDTTVVQRLLASKKTVVERAFGPATRRVAFASGRRACGAQALPAEGLLHGACAVERKPVSDYRIERGRRGSGGVDGPSC